MARRLPYGLDELELALDAAPPWRWESTERHYVAHGVLGVFKVTVKDRGGDLRIAYFAEGATEDHLLWTSMHEPYIDSEQSDEWHPAYVRHLKETLDLIPRLP